MEVNALTYIRADCTHNIAVPSEIFFILIITLVTSQKHLDGATYQ